MAESRARLYREWRCSLDDAPCPLRIECPDVLTQAELSDVKEFVALFIRQLERWAKREAGDV